jgi:hypothetical protein
MDITRYIGKSILLCFLTCTVLAATSCTKGGGSSKLGMLALFMIASSPGPSVDVPFISGSQPPTSAVITITQEQQSLSNTWYVKVAAYSNLNGRSVSEPSAEQSISLSGTCPCSIKVTWSPSAEPAVNRTGGGYLVYYSHNQNFSVQ